MTFPESNRIVDATGLHMEIIDTTTQKVWQALEASSHEVYRALELPEGFAKVGIGRSNMDESGFLRSPGSEQDGPMETIEIDGLVWSHCATPLGMTQPAGPDGPRQVSVDKHHVAIYHANRELDWLRLPDAGRYVQVIAARPEPALQLPDGWAIETEKLEAEMTILLPHPTTVFFFANGSSYQGPL